MNSFRARIGQPSASRPKIAVPAIPPFSPPRLTPARTPLYLEPPETLRFLHRQSRLLPGLLARSAPCLRTCSPRHAAGRSFRVPRPSAWHPCWGTRPSRLWAGARRNLAALRQSALLARRPLRWWPRSPGTLSRPAGPLFPPRHARCAPDSNLRMEMKTTRQPPGFILGPTVHRVLPPTAASLGCQGTA